MIKIFNTTKQNTKRDLPSPQHDDSSCFWIYLTVITVGPDSWMRRYTHIYMDWEGWTNIYRKNANEAELSWLAFSCFSKLTAVRLQGEFSCANKSWQGLFFPFHPQKSFNQYGGKAAASSEHNKAACLFSKSKGGLVCFLSQTENTLHCDHFTV